MSRLSLLFATVAIIVSLAGAAARAATASIPELLDAKVDYTADFYLVSDKGHFQGDVIHAPGRERRDFDTSSGHEALLLRRDIDQAAVMWPERKWYFSTSFLALADMIGGFDGVTVERTVEGRERISGEMTTRYRVSGRSGKGGFDGKMWFTADGILMKLAGRAIVGGRQFPVETGLSNLLRVKADAAAFNLPGDYKGVPIDISKLGGLGGLGLR